MEYPLTQRFVAQRGDGDPIASGPVLEPLLSDLHRAGTEAWPGIELAPESFVDHLAAHAPADPEALARVFAADLYLAGACARGDARAIRAFEEAMFGEIGRALRRQPASKIQRADLEQIVREKLFVAHGDAPAKITQYSGRGPLRLWVRVSVVRTLQNLVHRGPRETPLSDALAQSLQDAPVEPELAHMKRLYREQFRQALTEAVERLAVGDRLLLHQRFVQRVPQAALARAYEVHVNTIARWSRRARESFERELREALARRLELEVDQLGSVVAMVRSRLDVSLGRLLEGS